MPATYRLERRTARPAKRELRGSGRGGQIIKAPHTFEANTHGRETAGDWLRAEELRLNAEGASWRTLAEHAEDGRIRAAAQQVPTFGEYADVRPVRPRDPEPDG